MGIKIDNVSFQNYRQYGVSNLRFHHAKNHDLHVLIAKNGTGKTTFLNGITWCLYDKEMLSNNEDSKLPIVTSSVLNNSNLNDVITVSVALRIIDGNSYIEFKREQKCKVYERAEKVKDVIQSNSILTVTKTPMAGTANSIVMNGDEAAVIVKQYFDHEIYDFYFFDGENLQNYFEHDRYKDIKKAIYNISQVTLLENTISHIDAVKRDKIKAMSKGNTDLEALTTEEQRINDIVIEAKKARDSATERLKYLNDERDHLSNEIRNEKPLTTLQDRRDKLEQELDRLDIEEENYHIEYSKFIRESYINIKMYPLVKKVFQFIEVQRKAGKLPPKIDTDFINEILDNMSDTCPVCDQHIEGDVRDHARRHLEELLHKYDVTSETSNKLMGIRTTLSSMIKDAEEYNSNKQKLIDKRYDIITRKNDKNDELERISNDISRYGENNNKLDVKKMESRIRELSDEINTQNQLIGWNSQSIKSNERNLEEIRKQIDEATKKAAVAEKTKLEKELLQSLQNNFSEVMGEITSNMRLKIQRYTETGFRQMITKKNSFGRVEIGEDYSVDLYNPTNHKMTGSLSATEQMALAYAFTLAIHSASGKNCPLVIDSPLGRVSDTNRSNMARALYDVSKNKQIVMLFTPDEYSEEVRKIYENNVDVRELMLSDDESHIDKGVEKNG